MAGSALPRRRHGILIVAGGLGLLAGLVAALLAGLLTALPPPAQASGAATPPAPGTIVEVTGDAANGFEIQYHDGSARYPPTTSEAIAECGEYDRRIARVRCRVEVRTWYRDLADLQQALAWAHTRGRR